MIDLDDPVTTLRADVPPMSEQAYQHGLDRLQAAMAGVADPTRPRHRTRNAVVAVAAAAAAVSAGVIAFGQHQPANAASAEILRGAARYALSQPTLHPRPGQYVYQHVTRLDHGQRMTVDTWIPADASGRETICTAPEGGCTILNYQPGVATNSPAQPYDQLAAFPSTAKAMLQRLQDDPSTRALVAGGMSSDPAVWSTAVNYLRLLPPPQQAAVFEALASLHHVRRVGDVTTFDGRTGTAIGIDWNGEGQDQLIFDRTTHAFIGDRNLQPGASTPEFQGSAATSIIVNAVGQRS